MTYQFVRFRNRPTPPAMLPNTPPIPRVPSPVESLSLANSSEPDRCRSCGMPSVLSSAECSSSERTSSTNSS